jgi:DNA-binding transcriptional MerR regulator
MEKLLELMQRRLIEVECYRDLTRRLVYESVDNFPDLLQSRDELLAELAETGKQIEKQRAAMDDRDKNSSEAMAIEEKIAAVKETIAKDDKKVSRRIKNEMQETLDQIKNSEKTGRVASYIRKTTFNTSLGRSLNTIS